LTDGVAVTDAEVSLFNDDEGNHVYVEAPLTVSVVAEPSHTEVALLTVNTGTEFTTTLTVLPTLQF
jgi:hypothetical protein